MGDFPISILYHSCTYSFVVAKIQIISQIMCFFNEKVKKTNKKVFNQEKNCIFANKN
jgi:hypothetical protein